MAFKKYLSPAEFHMKITNFRNRNKKIDQILTICSNDWVRLPSSTKVSILRAINVHEDTDGYYILLETEDDSLLTVITKIKKEVYGTKI